MHFVPIQFSAVCVSVSVFQYHRDYMSVTVSVSVSMFGVHRCVKREGYSFVHRNFDRKFIDKWFINECLHKMHNHFSWLWCLNAHHNSSARWRYNTEMQWMFMMRKWKTETVRAWWKLVFDFQQQCFINTNGIPQFVIRLSWLWPHFQKCLIKMIECQIMTWLFDNEAQIILWCHLFSRLPHTNTLQTHAKQYKSRCSWLLVMWNRRT